MPVAQSQRRKIWLHAVILLAFAFSLRALSLRNPGLAAFGYDLLHRATEPFQRWASSLSRGSGSLWESYIALSNAAKENHELKKKVLRLESKLSEMFEFRHDNQVLRQMMSMPLHARKKGLPALVLSYDPSAYVRSLTIDRGRVDGVDEGSAVLAYGSVVGQVIHAGPGTSTVLLLADPGTAVDALLQSSRARGVVFGRGEDQYEMLFVDRQEEARVGDRVVSSGLDGVYPKGVLIGKVVASEEDTNSLFHRITVAPAVDVNRLEYVYVLPLREEVAEPKIELKSGGGES